MKYFHISAEFDLVNKPAWLKEYRRNFDVGYTYHVTLKNPTEIQDEKVLQMKEELTKVINESGINSVFVGDLVFNELKFNRTSSGKCVMVMSKGNKKLTDLQAEIHKKLSKYGKHVKPIYDMFENNFDPHFTIGRHLKGEKFEEAKRRLPRHIELKGLFKRITLIVVDDPIDEEWTDENNKMFFEP